MISRKDAFSKLEVTVCETDTVVRLTCHSCGCRAETPSLAMILLMTATEM